MKYILIMDFSPSFSPSFCRIKYGWINNVLEKERRSGSVSKIGSGEPFRFKAFRIFLKPVLRPSVRCISFKNSPIRRFL